MVRQALAPGINLLDTAATYGTDAVIGKAIKTVPRDCIVIATKALPHRDASLMPLTRGVESLERFLHQLDTDYADYRFVRHEPGVHVVLFGTSSPEHPRENIASLPKSPLPEPDRQRLAELFDHLLGVELELPDHQT